MQRLTTRFGRYAHIVRSPVPLQNVQLMQVVPSVFAENKHESRSERYTYVPTIQILEALRKEGFHPFYAAQSRVRDASNQEHTKHMLRFRHAANIEAGEANEIILINSHNGTSSYQMLSGVFRFVCKNGVVCGESFNDIRVPHKGDILSQVIEGAYTVLDDFKRVDEQVTSMKSLVLGEAQQRAFARAALTLKYDESKQTVPVTENDVLAVRRTADNSPDLWTTFNRVQENMVRGGMRARGANGKRFTTRPIYGIDQCVKLNRALWTLAEEMKKIMA